MPTGIMRGVTGKIESLLPDDARRLEAEDQNAIGSSIW
jgi:hypothetical protein